ncbi:hypothetical protein HZC09_00625 [Candidatus Micrarchaeota archaeon]|nr:hypothetical protein [Candidatus Micrarchaeota archaeon]
MVYESPVRKASVRAQYEPVYRKAEAFVRKEMETADPRLHYHDAKHPFEVDATAEKIAREAQTAGRVTEREVWLTKIFSLFHDLALIARSDKEGHAKLSAEIARHFLPGLGLTRKRDLDQGCKAISETEMVPHPTLETKWQNPKSRIGKFMCDADTANFGQTCFFRRNRDYLLEENRLYRNQIGEQESLERLLALLAAHQWHTFAAKKKFGVQKQRNIDRIRGKLERLQS